MEIRRARQIKSRHLSAFVEATRSGSLKTAAERLFLTQPAISKTLKDLEEIIGVQLLERGRGGVRLTREGEVFLPFAEQSLAALGHGLASLAGLSTGEAVPLRVGALPSVAGDFLPKAVNRFHDLSPATPITVEDGRVAPLLEQLRAGELEFVLGRMGPRETMQGLSFTPLYSDNVIFVARKGHPLGKGCTLDDLADWLVLYPPPKAAIRPLVDRFMMSRGVARLPHRLETVSGPFGRTMVLGERRALWVISQGVVASDLAGGQMVRLPIDTSEMSGPIGIMARSEEDPTPQMRLFRQALAEVR